MISVSIIFLNSKQETIYKIQSLNPDYKVEGQVVLNGSEGYLEIENIEVINLDKFKNVKIYDCDYYLLNSNGEIYSKRYVYGGFDSYDDPMYSYIDSINKIKFKVKIKSKDIKDKKDKYYFSINYTDAEILPQNEYIKLIISK